MPNHVTNIITFEDVTHDESLEIMKAIQNDEFGLGSIDFNKIIPMPENIFRGNLGSQEREEYGDANWYDWSVNNWNTKWNAYEFASFEPREESRTIEFCTAWSRPEPVIRKLSEMFPDAIIRHQYSDEDISFNVGEVEYQAGEEIFSDIPNSSSKEAFEMAAKIHGFDLAADGFVLTKDGTSYEYRDDEPEEHDEKIKVVLVKPMQKPEIALIESDLKSLQNTVGGSIEVVYPFEEQVVVICNEDGKSLELPLNRALKDSDGKVVDIIAGDFFICDGRGENFASLSDEQLKKYSDMFHTPERFKEVNGEIISVPATSNKSKNLER